MTDTLSFLKKKQRLLVNVAHIEKRGFTISGELPPKIFDIKNSNRLRCTNPLRYELHISLVSKAVLVAGKVSTVLHCKCDRCLTVYAHPLTNDGVCHFVDIPGDRQLDLTAKIREDMLIIFPQKFLCMQNCAGLCSSCGENLNIRKCNCGQCEDTFGVWSGLDKLRL